jgi:hypothetical protein
MSGEPTLTDTDAGLSAPDSHAGRLQRSLLERLRDHEMHGSLPTNGRFLFYELVALGILSKERKERKTGEGRAVATIRTTRVNFKLGERPQQGSHHRGKG